MTSLAAPYDHDRAQGYLRALADADPDADGDECGHSGPGGRCCRDRGHYDDDVWPVDVHVSYDTDHFESWKVGWRSREQKVAEIFRPDFGMTLTGTAEYRAGVEDTLRLVREILT